jgi:TonB C terminal
MLDNTGLPADRITMFEVLMLSDLTEEQKKVVQQLYQEKLANDTRIQTKLADLWLKELNDHPELVACGMQSETHPVPNILNSHDQQIEMMRIRSYAELSRYVSPKRMDSKQAPEKSLEFYRDQEKPLIDELNQIQKATWKAVESKLTAKQVEVLKQNRKAGVDSRNSRIAIAQSRASTPVTKPTPVQRPTQFNNSQSPSRQLTTRTGKRKGDVYGAGCRVDSELLTPADVYFGQYLVTHSYRLEGAWRVVRRRVPIEPGENEQTAVVTMIVDKHGTLSDTTLTSSSGNKEIDDQIMNVVAQATEPSGQFEALRWLPPGAPEKIKIRSTFRYNAVAKDTGQLSIDATEPKKFDYGPYIVELKKHALQAWFPPRRGNDSRDVTVTFSIFKNGEIRYPTLLDPSGELDLDQSALDTLQALVKAGPLPPLPSGADNLILQVIFHVGLARHEHSLATYIPADSFNTDIDKYALDVQRKLQANWHVPANVGQKPRRVVHKLNLFSPIGVGESAVFSCGNTEADLAASWALSTTARTAPKPDGMPIPSEFQFTFNYNPPGKH